MFKPERISNTSHHIKARKLTKLDNVLLYIWSFLISLLQNLLSIFLPNSHKLKKQLKDRRLYPEKIETIKKAREKFPNCVLFFCSSAGEYEQAKPLIDRFSSLKNIYIQILFFSNSGIKFANARQETIPYILTPVDTLKNCQKILSALKPHATIIVRHELWPAFICTAWQYGKVYLINASLSESDKNKKNNKSIFIKKTLFHFIDQIYTTDRNELTKLKTQFSLQDSKIQIAGDTKYDRVIERTHNNFNNIEQSKKSLNSFLGPSPRLIIGSAWPADYKLVLDCYCDNLNDTIRKNWNIIIALHEPSIENIKNLEAMCNNLDLKYQRFSHLFLDQSPGIENHKNRTPIIIIDSLGLLSELYGACTLAFIGGAIHHQVHNVIEPISHGLSIAFGNKYKNSNEAIELVKHGLATVCTSSKELATWWKLHQSSSEKNKRCLEYLDQHAGAADKIFNAIAKDIDIKLDT
ncbi:MAG: glycosyltransferase N-terminal domain-containing protein [Bdellovibrionota bacterium]